jgi:hypothetical protein
MTTFDGPTGDLRDADAEREIVEMALIDAAGFEYYAPDELDYADTDGPDWWTIFCESVARHADEARVTGQVTLADYHAADGGRA